MDGVRLAPDVAMGIVVTTEENVKRGEDVEQKISNYTSTPCCVLPDKEFEDWGAIVLLWL